MRYEIERGLINGTMRVKDIPERWRSLYEDLLGQTPSGDIDGCLQDIHWFYGLFGYFPTYTLGAVFASMQQSAMLHDHPDLQNEIENGNMETMKSWLDKKIWSVASLPDSSKVLCETVCNEEFSARYHIEYLKQKYH